MTTGEKITTLRKKKGLTQESLGEQIGVSRQAVSKWESDVTFPETDKLILLSKLFNVSVDYLLNIQNEKATNDNRKKLINFFPGIWSTSFFIITLLFYHELLLTPTFLILLYDICDSYYNILFCLCVYIHIYSSCI